MKITAEKRIVTPEEWATGANIVVFADGEKICDLSLYNFEPTRLATDESRVRLRALRDLLLEKLN